MRKVFTTVILLLSLNVLSQNYNYVWYHGGSTGSGNVIDVISRKNNSLLVGYNANIYDMDPSQNCVFSKGTSLAKYDDQKNLVLSDTIFPGTTNIKQDKKGNIYIVGKYNYAFDADPGPSVITITPTGQGNGYVIELDSNFNFVWAYHLKCQYSIVTSICFDENDNLYVYAEYQGTLDIDPGLGVSNITSPQNGIKKEFIIMKLSPNKSVSALIHCRAYSAGEMFIDNNRIYIAGRIDATVNINPLGTPVNINLTSGIKPFIAKYDTSLILEKSGSWIDNFNGANVHISTAGSGNIIIVSNASFTTDIDPSPDIHSAPAGYFILKMDTAFNYKWHVSPTGISDLQEALEMSDGKVLFYGGTYTAYVKLFDSTGSMISSFDIPGNYVEDLKNVTLLKDGRLFLPMGYNGVCDLDPGVGMVQYTSGGTSNRPLLVEYSLCQPKRTNLTISICHGEHYSMGDSNYYQTGIYAKYFYTGACDSIVTLNLTVKQVDTRLLPSIDTIYCVNIPNASYHWYNCTNKTTVSGQTHSFFLPPDNDSYAAIISTSGCIDTTNCVQRFQNSNIGFPSLAWGTAFKSRTELGIGHKLITDQFGNFYICGAFYGYWFTNLWAGNKGIGGFEGINNFPDGFIAKYDNNGIFQWAYNFGGQINNVNNPGYDCANSISVDGHGNVYATGYYNFSVDFDPRENYIYALPQLSSYKQGFILKLDPSGTLVWAKPLGGVSTNITPYTIAVAANGNIAIGGELTGTFGDFDPGPNTAILTGRGFIAMYDSICNYIGGLGIMENSSCQAICSSVCFDSDNNLIAGGYFSGNTDFDPGPGVYSFSISSGFSYFLAKYSPSFDIVWAKKIGAFSCGIYPTSRIHLDHTNNIYELKHNSLCRYAPNGTLSYQYPLSWSNYATSYQFDLDNSGNIYLFATYNGTVQLEPGLSFSAGSGTKEIVAKYNNNGTSAWGFVITPNQITNPTGIAVDGYGNFFIAGPTGPGCTGTFDIDPSANTYNISAANYFIAKYGNSCSRIDTSSTITNSNTVMNVSSNAFYEWKRCGDGTIVAYGTNPHFSADSSGFYYCVINMGACSDSTSCKYLLQGVFVDVRELDTRPEIIVYPNPTDDNVIIDLKQKYDNVTVEILNIMGQLISSKEYSSVESVNLPIEGAKGIYYLKIMIDNTELKAFKIIKN